MSGNVREQLTDWLGDFRLSSKGLQVRQTGHYVPLEWGTVLDARRWLTFYKALRDVPRIYAHGPTIFFTPQCARPWYFARAVVDVLGARIVSNIDDAEVIWSFDDSTYSSAVTKLGEMPVINGLCTDVSKSHVSEISERIFGTPLKVDPTIYRGEMVVKSEINGAHDGYLIEGPCTQKKGCVYQRLISNLTDEGLVEDLRTTIMGQKPVLVFRKQRPVASRFANSNTKVSLSMLSDVFSESEVAQISTVASALDLDAGGLDILRDRQTGELFVVDANKTDMGPPIALPLDDKIRATQMMACALSEYLEHQSVIKSKRKIVFECDRIFKKKDCKVT